jgi:hypothetical protein
MNESTLNRQIIILDLTATVGMFDNSYFDNSKRQKTDYVRQLGGLVYKKINIFIIERERDRESERQGERERQRERERDRERERERQREKEREKERERDLT